MTIKFIETDQQLSDVMDMDHVIRVNGDGTVDTSPETTRYAPTVEFYNGELDKSQLGDWTLLSGFTGQYSYTGPIMHSSEYIGGGLARFILDTPGYYAAVVVNAPCDYDGSTDCDEATGCDCEPAGWAIAYHP